MECVISRKGDLRIDCGEVIGERRVWVGSGECGEYAGITLFFIKRFLRELSGGCLVSVTTYS